MDQLTDYRIKIKELLTKYLLLCKPSYGDVEVEKIFETEQDHYQIIGVASSWDDVGMYNISKSYKRNNILSCKLGEIIPQGCNAKLLVSDGTIKNEFILHSARHKVLGGKYQNQATYFEQNIDKNTQSFVNSQNKNANFAALLSLLSITSSLMRINKHNKFVSFIFFIYSFMIDYICTFKSDKLPR